MSNNTEKLNITIGKTYLNQKGEKNTITGYVSETSNDYIVFQMRFVDGVGRQYRSDGCNNKLGLESVFDLIEQID